MSWLVSAVRKDAFIKENPIEVEAEKTESEKTFILHEEAYERQGRLPPGYVKRKDRPQREVL